MKEPIEYDPGDEDIVEGVRTVEWCAGELSKYFDDMDKDGDESDKFDSVDGRGVDTDGDPLD